MTSQLQVGDDLRLVDGLHGFNGFEFDDQTALDEQVDSKPAEERTFLVRNGYGAFLSLIHI